MAIMAAAHAGQPAIAAQQAAAHPHLPSEGHPLLVTERARRAQANLEALLQGRIRISDLSPQDYKDVIDLDRILRGGTSDDRSFDQQCINREVSRNDGAPTRLAWEVIKLKCR